MNRGGRERDKDGEQRQNGDLSKRLGASDDGQQQEFHERLPRNSSTSVVFDFRRV
jgi:hypothetical protein